jgi:hypothetical protein
MATTQQFPPQRRIPARYVGQHAVVAPPGEDGRPLVQADGSPLPTARVITSIDANRHVTTAVLPVMVTGTTVMMDEDSILGHTLEIDPSHQQPTLWMGYGWCPEERHQGLFPHQLQNMRFVGPDSVLRTYQFHSGRTDFEPLYPEQEPAYYRYPSREQQAMTADADADALTQAEQNEAAFWQATHFASASASASSSDVSAATDADNVAVEDAAPSVSTPARARRTAAAAPADTADAAQEE